jgi:6-pyruvoyltetrahydropterin/6-carboxytetrahydropterin synthase
VIEKMLVLLLILVICVTLSRGHSGGADHGSSGYSLGIRDSIMIAHSFKGEEFGPAQNLHGATYTVDVSFEKEELVEKLNWVIDIGEASTMLSDVLAQYNFKNLDEICGDENTTTEYMCKAIHSAMRERLSAKNFKGGLRVKLFESHKAWASYYDAV